MYYCSCNLLIKYITILTITSGNYMKRSIIQKNYTVYLFYRCVVCMCVIYLSRIPSVIFFLRCCAICCKYTCLVFHLQCVFFDWCVVYFLLLQAWVWWEHIRKEGRLQQLQCPPETQDQFVPHQGKEQTLVMSLLSWRISLVVVLFDVHSCVTLLVPSDADGFECFLYIYSSQDDVLLAVHVFAGRNLSHPVVQFSSVHQFAWWSVICIILNIFRVLRPGTST